MRVRIEFDRRDEYRFLTLHSPLGEYRALQIKIDGRAFSTFYHVNEFRRFDESYIKHLDNQLVVSFEKMIGKVLSGAIAAVPDGANLLDTQDVMDIASR